MVGYADNKRRRVDSSLECLELCSSVDLTMYALAYVLVAGGPALGVVFDGSDVVIRFGIRIYS